MSPKTYVKADCTKYATNKWHVSSISSKTKRANDADRQMSNVLCFDVLFNGYALEIIFIKSLLEPLCHPMKYYRSRKGTIYACAGSKSHFCEEPTNRWRLGDPCRSCDRSVWETVSETKMEKGTLKWVVEHDNTPFEKLYISNICISSDHETAKVPDWISTDNTSVSNRYFDYR